MRTASLLLLIATAATAATISTAGPAISFTVTAAGTVDFGLRLQDFGPNGYLQAAIPTVAQLSDDPDPFWLCGNGAGARNRCLLPMGPGTYTLVLNAFDASGLATVDGDVVAAALADPPAGLPTPEPADWTFIGYALVGGFAFYVVRKSKADRLKRKTPRQP